MNNATNPATAAVILGLSADTTINLILLLVCLGFVGYTVMLLATTKEMRRLSDWLNARADARDFMEARYKAYRLKREAGITIIHGQGGFAETGELGK